MPSDKRAMSQEKQLSMLKSKAIHDIIHSNRYLIKLPMTTWIVFVSVLWYISRNTQSRTVRIHSVLVNFSVKEWFSNWVFIEGTNGILHQNCIPFYLFILANSHLRRAIN
ncbi:hypothetical protein T01_2831 [Trichinella spiralis]|uniref:Uncharacterized protein n=1 Tax=Trichinella spiralis TaxID=6334 RepID=A0A0V1BCJ8_TRISP|nr:hypothetical protein T01_2831 [Trichinella spiralis]